MTLAFTNAVGEMRFEPRGLRSVTKAGTGSSKPPKAKNSSRRVSRELQGSQRVFARDAAGDVPRAPPTAPISQGGRGPRRAPLHPDALPPPSSCPRHRGVCSLQGRSRVGARGVIP